jgi:polyphosphate glucokinase
MRALVVDFGGTHVKVLATGQRAPREFPSGPTLTAERMVDGVKTSGVGWAYDAVSIGYPGPVLHGCPVAEPSHLGPGWVGFDYRAAFARLVKVVNDAAMQALGRYRGGGNVHNWKRYRQAAAPVTTRTRSSAVSVSGSDH